MTKFIKDRFSAAGLNGILLKCLGEATRKTVEAVVEARKTAISPRNFGYVLGSTARMTARPWRELWRGMKQGFTAGE